MLLLLLHCDRNNTAPDEEGTSVVATAHILHARHLADSVESAVLQSSHLGQATEGNLLDVPIGVSGSYPIPKQPPFEEMGHCKPYLT